MQYHYKVDAFVSVQFSWGDWTSKCKNRTSRTWKLAYGLVFNYSAEAV